MSPEDAVVLDTEVEDLWTCYLAANRKHVRNEMKQSLDAFIGRLLACEESTWKAWALQFAREVSDHGRDVPVRVPLFRRVLFPALRDGLIGKFPGCARWLAHFNQLLYQSAACLDELPETQRSEGGLLLEALRVDPSDIQSRRRLVVADAWQLRHCIHEIPAGVLYGMDGATVEQCEELSDRVDEFEMHAKLTGQDAFYRELIDECRFHFQTYAEYLRSGRAHGTYKAFLDARS